MYRCLVIITLGFSLTGCLQEEQVVRRANVSDGQAAPIDSIAWPRERTRTNSWPPVRSVPSRPVTSVAPVAELVSGLQERLAEDPDDVKGWALLAQSYAFMTDRPKAEEAIARAVELGFDEEDLRHRVEMAFQSARIPDQTESTWISQQ